MSLLLAFVLVSQQTPAELPAPTPGWIVFAASWSPDGNKIVYSAMQKEATAKFDPAKVSLYMVNADGSGRKKLPIVAFNADFTPDGKALIVGLNTKPNSSMIRYDLETETTTTLLEKPTRISAAVCSPSGDKIAYNIEVDPAKHLQHMYMCNMDGSGEKEIQGGPGSAYTPMWSFDGKQIAFYRELGDQKDQIYVMDADGSNVKHLSNSGEHNFYPSFMPNGDVSFTNFVNKEQHVVIVGQDGTRKSVWPYNSSNVKWSMAGKAVFTAGRFPLSALYVANADGSGAVKISE